jgi:RNA polymerase sigma-70 factor (family 1)
MKDMQDRTFTEEDFNLLSAIKERDKKSFETLYKRYYKQLFALACRYVDQAETAEEIVHDVFIAIWNKAELIDIKYSMKSYLFKAVVNTSLNFIKKEKMNAEKRSTYLAVQETEVEEEELKREEALLESLEEALKLLPEKCKQVMYLSKFGKLKQQEIADQMEISVKTVKNHLTYGFQKLRDHIEKKQQAIISLLFIINLFIRS